MKKHLLKTVAAALVLGVASAGALAQNVAIVNGKPVPKARLDVLAQQLVASGRPITPEMEPQLRDEIIAREIFMQEAQKQGLGTTPDSGRCSRTTASRTRSPTRTSRPSTTSSWRPTAARNTRRATSWWRPNPRH
jgi:hypothetical protein